MGFTLEGSIFFHMLIAGDRKIFTGKIVITIEITDNNMSSYSLIKLPCCHIRLVIYLLISLKIGKNY